MNRAGRYILNKAERDQSFRPAPLPPQPALDISDDISRLLLEASRNLQKLDAAARLLPCTESFVSMYVRKEALLSSQIEGSQCTLEDVLNSELDINANSDVADVVNCVKAMQYAMEQREKLPICNRLLRSIHAVLMEGVRGQAGEFRCSQNWIGPAGCSLKNARYIPPNVEDMEASMAALEQYISENQEYDPLIQAALIHYQFETIHPFPDGNGRIGRLLILLYLMEKKLLCKPVICVSCFLKRNQIEYYDRISEVRRSGNYEQWVRFFLETVSVAAADAMKSIERLSALHDQSLRLLPRATRSKDNVRAVFDYWEQHPIMDIKNAAAALEVSYNTVSAAVKKLMELDILRETTNAARNRVFAYEKYLAILQDGT